MPKAVVPTKLRFLFFESVLPIGFLAVASTAIVPKAVVPTRARLSLRDSVLPLGLLAVEVRRWWLGLVLVGYSIGSTIAAMRVGGALFVVTASAPLLIILIPHFATSVRSTFGVDRRGLLTGIGLLVACIGARAVFSIAP